MWNNIKAWFKHSLTILWARALAVIGVAFAAGQALLQDQSITSTIKTVLKPEYTPYYVIAIAFLTEMARRRTIGKD